MFEVSVSASPKSEWTLMSLSEAESEQSLNCAASSGWGRLYSFCGLKSASASSWAADDMTTKRGEGEEEVMESWGVGGGGEAWDELV